MRPVEDFLQEYFRARTESHREFARMQQPVAEKFFTPAYRSYRPEVAIQYSEAEKILSVSLLEQGAEVVTSGCLGDRYRMRYQLQLAADSWRIDNIELECGLCRGSGKRKHRHGDCQLCKGRGWHSMGEKQIIGDK